MKFLIHFGKTKNGKIIVFDIFTFNNLFSLLLNEKLKHEEALSFILAESELNAYVYQECIHNNAYLNLTPANINYYEAGRRSILHQIAFSFI